MNRGTCGIALAMFALGTAPLPATGSAPAKIPLCAGLTIVTAISQREGDYESIKTVTAIEGEEVQLRYSAERPPERLGGGVRLQKLIVPRVIRVQDLLDARQYEQIFGVNIPTKMAGTTAIGVSRAVFLALKTKGAAALDMFDIPPALPGASVKVATDPKEHPNVFDYAETYQLRRLESGPVTLHVIVNDTLTELPTIHATGRSDYYGYKAEFFILDDEDNPLALKWRLGIGAGSGANLGGDRDTLQVIKIAYACSGTTAHLSELERALAATGHADVYSIFFSFNSDALREESEPTLREIGAIMRRHPDWKLSVAGHTDSVGGDAPNLDLSKRRAASVKSALVSRFGVTADRLVTDGHGRSRPIDTNATEEGRARNRRVELVRLP
jgi:outer membrane protein OmpA-like peptidoglycan-associated protein